MARRNLRALFRLLDEHPRVARVIEANGRLEIHMVSAVAPTAAGFGAGAPPEEAEKEDPTPTEWLSQQYKKPDGT